MPENVAHVIVVTCRWRLAKRQELNELWLRYAWEELQVRRPDLFTPR